MKYRILLATLFILANAKPSIYNLNNNTFLK